MKANKLLVLAFAGIILAAVACDSAMAATYRYSSIQSQLSGSGSSVSASWVTVDPNENLNVPSSTTPGSIIACKNYYQNSADRGTVDSYWGRDVFNKNGIINPNYGYTSAIAIAQGQTEWVDQTAGLENSKPTGSYRFEQGHIYYPRPATEVWNPSQMTQKGLTITT